MFIPLVVFPVYGVIAIVTILILRKKARNTVTITPLDDVKIIESYPDNMGTVPMPVISADALFHKQVADGKHPAQIASFSFTIILGMLGVILLSSLFIQPSFILFALILLIPLTFITIIVNIFWVYNKKIIFAEEQAYVLKTSSSLLKTERISAWFIWVGYLVTYFGIICFSFLTS